MSSSEFAYNRAWGYRAFDFVSRVRKGGCGDVGRVSRRILSRLTKSKELLSGAAGLLLPYAYGFAVSGLVCWVRVQDNWRCEVSPWTPGIVPLKCAEP